MPEANLWSRVKRVSFELSNRCTLAGEHAKCPLHAHAGPPAHLPAVQVLLALQELGHHGFNGRVAFHTYCEPLVDPRLFVFIQGAADHCPDASVFLMSNGWNLDQQILDELATFPNVRQIEISAYTEAEHARLKALRAPEGVAWKLVGRYKLDDRLGIYDREPIPLGPDAVCDAPFGEVVVRHTGDIGLCCFDWACSTSFGNIKDGLGAFVESDYAERVYRELQAGVRHTPICQRCGISRKGGTR